MAVTSVCFKFSLFAAMFVALVCTDVAKAQKNSGLAAALAGYLRPAAVAAEQRIRACNGQGDQSTAPTMINDSGECSKILKTIVQDGSMSGLKSQLSIKHTKGLPKNYLLEYAGQFKSILGMTKAEFSKFQSGLKEAVKGTKPVFLKSMKCDANGMCKYLLFTTGPYKKDQLELFVLKSAMEFSVAPDIVIVQQTVTDPETGLPAGNKIVMKDVPRAKEQGVEDVMVYFDKYVYEEMKKVLKKGGSGSGTGRKDPPPPPQVNPFLDQGTEEEETNDIDDNFRSQFQQIVSSGYSACVRHCFVLTGDSLRCRSKCKMDGKDAIRESKEQARHIVNTMFDESPSNEFMMDSADSGKVQGIERYSPNKQREQALIDACYNAGLRGAEARQFMAQCSHECDHFNTMEEYASGAAYEGRSDLGNTQPGDGRRFKGRGYIQLTGRANYIDVGRAIGVDLVNNPTRATEPAIAAKVALHFWKTRVRRRVSNFCDTYAVTRVINGGTNGLADRKSKFAKYGGCSSGGSSSGGSSSSGGNVAGSCATCLKSGGGKGCASRCPSNSACQSCVKYGGGKGCLTNSKCGTCSGTCFNSYSGTCSASVQYGKCPGSSSIVCCPSSLSSGSMYDTSSDMDEGYQSVGHAIDLEASSGLGRITNRNLREAVAPSSGNWKYDPVGAGSSIRDMLVNRESD